MSVLRLCYGVVPNSDPCQIITPPSIGRFRDRCGGGVRIMQFYRDFNERGNILAGGQKWAQQERTILKAYRKSNASFLFNNKHSQ